MASNQEQLARHYQREHLEETILNALRAAGNDPDTLSPDDLAPIDQFHTGGREATIELAERVGIIAGMHVLDVGGGIGGPARTLARQYGCRVTVLDLSESFCRTGTTLTERVGMGEAVTFQQGNALDLPFDDASFDLVWTQHSTMNIPDKPRLYAELHRVLHPGGRYACHEILAGPNQPIHFPAPWAEMPSNSFLATSDDTRQYLADAGFEETLWLDLSEQALAFFSARAAAAQASGPPPLGLHLIVGPVFREMVANLVRNLREQRVRVVQGVVERRDTTPG